MLSVLITSTKKSEPLRASVSGVASGSTFSLGGTGGTLSDRGAGVCPAALFAAAARPSAGPAATAPARNWRRFILGDLDKAASLIFGANLPLGRDKTKRAAGNDNSYSSSCPSRANAQTGFVRQKSHLQLTGLETQQKGPHFAMRA